MKKKLRKELTILRDSIRKEIQEQAPDQCMKHLREWKAYQQTEWIYIFLSFRSELNTLVMIEEMMKDGKKIACPRVEGKDMNFYHIRSLQDCLAGSWGILEPKEDCELVTQPGCMLLPGLGFDLTGGRIGYGGGFYDRYLEKRNDLIKIGLAYEEQLVEGLEMEEHDIRIDYLLTPIKMRYIEKNV